MRKIKKNVVDIIVFVILASFYIVEAFLRLFVPLKYRMKKVAGDVALITGGGGGLGRLLAEKFSKLGCTIVIWDINKQAIDETVEIVKSQGGKAYGYVCDITKREIVYKTAELVNNEVGTVTILINNAGIVSGKPLLQTPDHLIQKTFDVNVIAHFWTTKAFLPGMIESKKGHIVTIASMAGTVGMTKLVDYCASKFAALGFDESLRIELESYGHNYIHATCVCPYFIKSTGMFDGVATRFVPILEASFVADKVVEAVLLNQQQVYLPWFFRILICLKELMPWTVVAMFLRTLVHDAHPDHIANKQFDSENNEKFNSFTSSTTKILETSRNIEHNHHRDSSSSERKP